MSTDDNGREKDTATGTNGEAERLPVIEAEPVEEGGESPAPAAPRRRGGWLPALLVGWLLAGAGTAAGWYGWQRIEALHGELAARAARIEALEARLGEVAATREALARLERAVGEWRQAAERERAATERRLDTLQAAVESARDLVSRAQRDWIVAEVEYLVRIANQRLRLMRDYEGAIAALEAADGRLRDLADPALLPVRERLADDIRRLRDAERPDLVGIALRLDRMVASLRPLPLRVPARETGEAERPAEAAAPQAADEPAPARSLSALLEDAWKTLSRRVTVRHYDAPVQHLPDRERELMLAQLLRLRLEAARVDVLRQDDADYHRQLRAALELIDTYYHARSAHPLRAEIEALDKVNLRPPLPEITGAIALLERLQADWRRRRETPPATPAEAAAP